MPLVQQKIAGALRQAAAQGRAPGRVRGAGRGAAGATRCGTIDSVTLLDALSMPIGYALPERPRSRKVIEKNSQHPLDEELPPAAAQGAGSAFIELDIFQGDSDLIVDNEYLGTVQVARRRRRGSEIELQARRGVPAARDGGGRRPAITREVMLATRDTPEALKAALAGGVASGAGSRRSGRAPAKASSLAACSPRSAKSSAGNEVSLPRVVRGPAAALLRDPSVHCRHAPGSGRWSRASSSRRAAGSRRTSACWCAPGPARA